MTFVSKYERNLNKYISFRILENENSTVHSPQEYIESSIEETIHLADASAQENDIEVKHRSGAVKKHSSKSKKK